ncbi:hypothetical protein [Bremerella volcania]|nr:hypothetical protein [Bremerella volcania]
MVDRFSGAELFVDFATIFRLTDDPPLPPLEWAVEWCIDAMTTKWRVAGTGREQDWALAMTNYGGLILLDSQGLVKEWDTGQATWLNKDISLQDWLDGIMTEGESLMEDS